MKLALDVLCVAAVLELVLYLPFFWRARRFFAILALIANTVSVILLLAARFDVAWLLVAFFGVYRLINLRRVYIGRIQYKYLRQAGWQASIWLIAAQAAVLLVAAAVRAIKPSSALLWWLAAVLQLALVTALIVTLRKNAQASVLYESEPVPINELPALSVLIPARNETHELEKCLESLITSTYPKLEIIVLDDSSQNKRTPEIIRSFAQHGVRFIPGDAPPDGWLAKNYAYKELIEAASGELLLFCGVDTRFKPRSLGLLVNEFLDSKIRMVGVLPQNSSNKRSLWRAVSIQPLRYAWELALPREKRASPPVLSTCWLIAREQLDAAGGFDAVRQKIIPEAYFAKQAKLASKYAFVSTGDEVVSTKSYDEQRSTAVRTRYPMLHRRIETVAWVSLFEAWIFAAPLVLLVYGLTQQPPILLGALAGFAALGYFGVLLSRVTYQKSLPAGFWLAMPAGLNDVWLLNYSMWQYEFGEVLWKGRNVCIPVMNVFRPETTSN